MHTLWPDIYYPGLKNISNLALALAAVLLFVSFFASLLSMSDYSIAKFNCKGSKTVASYPNYSTTATCLYTHKEPCRGSANLRQKAYTKSRFTYLNQKERRKDPGTEQYLASFDRNTLFDR